MAELPEKRLLGLHQYKAPPILARQTAARPVHAHAAPAPSESQATSAGDDYERIEGVEEGSYSGEVMPMPSEGDDSPVGGGNSEAVPEARQANEEVIIAAALNKAEEETSKKKLPSIGEMLPLVPVPVQEALEDLFRAKWTRVVRVKKRDLFQP